MRLLVIDHSLINLRGHHFNYDTAIYRAARTSGVPSLFFCHRACSMEILNELPACPVFSADTYCQLTQLPYDSPDHLSDDYRLHCEIFYRELCTHITPAFQSGDLILFHTIQLPELDAIGRWYASLQGERPRIAIVLRFDIFAGLRHRLFPEKSKEIYHALIPALYQIEPSKVRFYSDTRHMAEQYRGCGVPFHLIPIPLDAPSEQSDQQTNDLHLVFLGDAFPHKGFGQIVEAIPLVLQQDPRIRCTIQVTNASQPFDSLRGYHQVRLIEERPSEDDYYRILSSASALLLPYDPAVYQYQSSHIFIEAVLRGIPVICSDNGSMVPDLTDCGMTELIFSPYCSQALADSILRFAESPQTWKRLFVRQTEALARTHTGENFIATLWSQDAAEQAPPAPPPRKSSELDSIIAPEIRDDEFYNLIVELARTQEIATVLEIGSSAGGGSTEAFVTGLAANPKAPKLFCMEVSRPRFEELSRRYAGHGFVTCYNTSSVALAGFATPAKLTEFYNSTPTNLNYYPLQRVLGWLQQDLDYVREAGFDQDGIELIRRENRLEHFDMVLIDGSEFTGASELDRVYGARWLLLDDVNAYKNFANYQRLQQDPNYELFRENWQLRNGYAVFKKKESELPVHFFTIVLNGMPFIRYHIDMLQELPFKWHWHIVEGVADLVHDTAWSLQLGATIPEAFHRNGRSNDGTSEYLNQLKARFPDQIDIYRKPEGCFWDGKLEMVQAPVPYLPDDCLLWQVDVDEFWTAQQVKSVRKMFAEQPDKTAAFYWCHFFVGPQLVVDSRHCYSQNPDVEWLRTWRFTRGCQWIAHEPPRLHRLLPDGSSADLARINPFLHDETEQQGLVFQHFAYVLPEQLKFKESYYGYRGALACWTRLQEQQQFPVYLRDYLPWVGDHTTVIPAAARQVVPIELPVAPRELPLTVVDGVFFQMNNTGIARVWKSILCEWAKSDFGKSVLVLDRAGTAPRIPGLRYRIVPPYDCAPAGWDRRMLQQVCDEEGAGLFISTYYTTPLSTPSLFLAYDMIPEFTTYYDLSEPQWQEKHHAISRASAFAAISRSTATDLAKLYPHLAGRVTVAHCGLDRGQFFPASSSAIQQFKERHHIDKPYFVFVGGRNGYKNGKLLLQALAQIPDRESYLLLYIGGQPELEPSLQALAREAKVEVRVAQLSDPELNIAYSGAVAFVYPSMYEGFGLPILEAMACGCPVITCWNSSLPEVAGAAALYVNHDDPQQLATALHQVQVPEVRQQLIKMGSGQAAKFTWGKMADTMRGVITSQLDSAAAGADVQPHGKVSAGA